MRHLIVDPVNQNLINVSWGIGRNSSTCIFHKAKASKDSIYHWPRYIPVAVKNIHKVQDSVLPIPLCIFHSPCFYNLLLHWYLNKINGFLYSVIPGINSEPEDHVATFS